MFGRESDQSRQAATHMMTKCGAGLIGVAGSQCIQDKLVLLNGSLPAFWPKIRGISRSIDLQSELIPYIKKDRIRRNHDYFAMEFFVFFEVIREIISALV